MSLTRPITIVIFLVILLAAAGTSLFFLLPTGEPTQEDPHLLVAGVEGYVDSQICMACHSEIYENYQRTGMGSAFYRMRPEKAVEDWSTDNTFYHEASDRYYAMYERDGKYYQRRHQLGFEGKETNVVEKEIHWVVGSGLAARTYLHRTPDDKLLELPVAWYKENGGTWAMNPGYDRPNHLGFRRALDHQCMFCHNGYPEIEPAADRAGKSSVFPGRMPGGIDCQRCHGPGQNHVETVQAEDSTDEEVRSSIVNPARLDPQRQLEVCISCHLQTTTARLPGSIVRFDRGYFSFQPGQALSDYVVHFDHPSGSGYEDKFEVLSAAYRLFQSACFIESEGSMTCITCHNPHSTLRGEETVQRYVAICRDCHDADLEPRIATNQHTESSDCLGCHMPKRRTEDVIHAVMTDHRVQRHKPTRDLLAPLEEDAFYGRNYRGEVVFYEPLPSGPDRELYLAVAQVKNNANLGSGIPRLERAMEKYRPEQGEFYQTLADGYWETGEYLKAIPVYQEALLRKSDLWPAQHKLGMAYFRAGQLEAAVRELQKAAAMGVEEALTLSDLSLVYQDMERPQAAQAALRKAIALDPDMPQAYNNLGVALMELGNPVDAEKVFRNAIRIQPDFAGAHVNLAKALSGDLLQAQYHFEKAIHHNPDSAQTRFDYGLTLAQAQRYEEAQEQLEIAVRLRPAWAEAHNTLAEILGVRGRISEAIRHLRLALELEPRNHQAHLNLGGSLAMTGNFQEALSHLQEAAKSGDSLVRQQAADLIGQIQGQNR